LKNIFKEMRTDLDLPIPDHGCLTAWAEQGVLLLNTILTLREGQPLSHKERGGRFSQTRSFGRSARSPKELCSCFGGRPRKADEADRYVEACRDSERASSPLSARAFFGSRPFSRINAALREAGQPEIDWRIPEI
jgi:uracil-DNA glycosylase